MAQVFSWSGNGLAAGVFDPATSIGTGDTAFTAKYGDPSRQAISADGLRAPRLAINDTAATASGVEWTSGSVLSTFAVRTYFEFTSYSTTNSASVIAGLRPDPGGTATPRVSWRFDISPAGQIRFRGDNATAVWSPTTMQMVANTLYRIEIVVNGTTAAVYVYEGESTTALFSNTSLTVADGMTLLRVGETLTDNLKGKRYDDIQVTNTATLIGPVVAATPVVTTNGDQTVTPYQTVTLSAQVTGTQTAPTWTQISGQPAVTLAGSGATRTFVAPTTRGGTTLGFRASVSGVTADSSVTVLPHSEWAAQDGGEVPLRI